MTKAKTSIGSICMPLGLAAAVTLIYSQLLTAGFLGIDDNAHIYANPYFLPVTPTHIAHFWLHPYQSLYIPISYTLLGLLALAARTAPGFGEFGFDPRVFHAANILLHLCNMLIVFSILKRLSGNASAAATGALFFGVHPVQVESVAWISEFRGLLSALFALLAIRLHLDIDDKTCVTCGTGDAATLLLYILAILSKPAAVGAIGVVIAIDRWILGRGWKQTAALPVAMALAAIPVLAITQGVQGLPAALITPVVDRPLIMGDDLAFYLGKIVCPINLCVVYGRTTHFVLSQPWGRWSWLVPAAVGALAIAARRKVPWMLASTVMFVCCLAPVLGLAPFLYQSHSNVADRYLYLAMIGPATAVCHFVAISRSRWIKVVMVPLFLVLGCLTYLQTTYWANDLALLSYAVTVCPDSAYAHIWLAEAFDRAGDQRKAASEYEIGAKIAPEALDPSLSPMAEDVPSGYLEAGYVLQSQHKNIGAQASADNNLGVVLLQHNEPAEAMREFRNAAIGDPRCATALANIGAVYAQTGNFILARQFFEKSIAVDPGCVKAHLGLADLAMQGRDFPDAVSEYQRAKASLPASAEICTMLGVAYAGEHDWDESIAQFEQALRLTPGDPSAASFLNQARQSLAHDPTAANRRAP